MANEERLGLNSFSSIQEKLKEEFEYRLEIFKIIDRDAELFKKASLEEQNKLFDELMHEINNDSNLRKKIESYYEDLI